MQAQAIQGTPRREELLFGGLPRGLHGRVRFLVDRHGRVHLDLTWAPWTTPLVAAWRDGGWRA